MTRLEAERFGEPATLRDLRVLRFARERAVDGLAGRTVWCATALPGGRDAASRLRRSLEWARDEGVAAEPLEGERAGAFEELGRRLDAMLRGSARAVPRPGAAEDEVCSQGVGAGEDLVRDGVREGDVVVAHDPLTALLAEAVRGRGAHIVWHVSAGGPSRQATAENAWRFLRRYTAAVDAYVTSAGGGSQGAERVALLMPCPDVVREREIGANHGVGWGNVLADVVETDRGEHVGGIMHARPTVATR